MLVVQNSWAYNPPTPDGYVMDLAGKLSTSQRTDLNAKLNGINKNTKNEFAVLIIPTLGDELIDDVAQDTFKSWKVGKVGLDNGVLIVIAVAERKSRIQTGKGVEGDLTDLQSNDILRNKLNPHLKQGDFYGGLVDTFDAIISTVESRKLVPISNTIHVTKAQELSTSPQSNDAWVFCGLACIIGTISIVVWMFISANNKRKREVERDKFLRLKRDQEAKHQRDVAAFKLRQQGEKERDSENERDFNRISKNVHDRVSGFDLPTSSNTIGTVTHHTTKKSKISTPAVAVAAGVAVAATAVALDVEARRRRENEDAARRRRERDVEERRQREREEDRRTSYSPSSTSIFGSDDNSSSSSYDSGGGNDFGGFGGGDSGGGGSSSDF